MGDSLVAENANTSEGVQVSLHPLPLLNISEHYTRVRIQSAASSTGSANGDAGVKVIGALIGIQQGREIEIVNSFELATTADGAEVNHEFFIARQSQFKQVFPNFEFLGWYTVGTQPTPLDLNIHTQLLAYNESPIFLQLHPTGTSPSPSAANAGSNLPLDIYESIVDIVNGKSETRFVRIAGEDGGYRVETGEAERIAVESASRTAVASASGNKAGQESSESALIAGLSTHRNAVAMLHSRIAVILQYLDGIKKGTQPADHETLRQIASLVASVTSSTSEAQQPGPSGAVAAASFTDEFDREQNDVLLTTLLGQMTKTLEQTNVLVDKFSLQQQRERDDPDAGFGSLRKAGGGRRGVTGGAGGRGRDLGGFF